MRILALVFMVLSTAFGMSINSVEVMRSGIKFSVEGADYNDIGKIYSSSLMECNPKLDGVFHLESGSNLIFYSKANLPTSTNFSCKFNDISINFRSSDFRVITFENVKKDSFFLAFNDSVEEIKKYINLSDETLKFNISNVGSNGFIIDVENPNNLKYDIKISSNLTSINGAKLNDSISLSQTNSLNTLGFERLGIDSSLIEGISHPRKMLGFRIYFDNYININSLLLKSSEAQNFTVLDTNFIEKDGKNYFYTDIISRDFKPDKEYEVTLLEGFGQIYDKWGTVLKDEVKFKFKTPNYKKEVSFADEKPYISSRGGVFINSVNVSEIKTMLSKVDDENIRYFLNFSDGNESFSEYKTKNFSLDMAPNEDINSTIKFSDLDDGIYKFDVFYKDKDEIKSITKYLYFSDIAVHAKVFNDSVFIFLNRLSSDEVISGAKVTLFSDKNRVILRGESGKDGTVSMDKKDLLKERPKSLLVEYKDERNFLIFNEKNGEFENMYQKTPSKVKAYIYLASDIIRPNTPLKGAVILKENFKSLSNLPINIKIFDPKNSEIYSASKTLDEFGSLSLEIKDGFELGGKYLLKVVFEDKVLTTKEFSVESFVAQSLKASAKFSKDNFTLNDNIFINLSASYLFGQNASNLSGNLNINISNSTFKHPKFKEYKFDDESIYTSPIYSYNAPILLDDSKNLEFLIDPNFKTKLNSKLDINANFMVNDGGKSSSDYASSVIYPHNSIVGIQNNNQNFSFISINPLTLKDTNSTLKATLYEESWNYNYSDKGYLSWVNTYKKLDEFDIKDNHLNLQNLPNGAYKLVATDLNSTHSSAISFSVGAVLTPSKELNLATITTNKDSYIKDDTIIADISSPLKDALLLVTLEDDRVLSHQIIKVDNYSARVEFKIESEFSGMYLSVKALRVADTPSYLLPFKAQNSVYIAKDSSDKKLNLEAIIPETARSNEDIEISVKTTPNSKIYLFAVDYGVLNIIDQKSPEAFKFFSTIKERNFSNFDIYNELTHFKTNGKTLSFGSGGEMMLMSMKKYLDPVESRENFIKMYEAISDENGTAKFSLNVPINSKIRADIIAINSEKVNELSKDIVIKDDINIKMPNILYLLKGDKVELPVRIFNNTDEAKTLNLDINSNLAINDINKTLNLKPNSFETLNLKVSTDNIIKANINILNQSLKFSVLQNSSLNTKVINGILDTDKTINLKGDYKTAKLTISNSPLAMFFDDTQKLIKYPYGCSEQISSKILAMFYTNPKSKQKDYFIQNGINELISRQKESGDFGYWDAQSSVNYYSSVYTTHTLLTLKESGFNVPDMVIKKALNALRNKGISDRLTDIYAAFLLSENNTISDDKINIFYDKKYYKKSFLNHYLMAVILKNAGLLKELEVVKNEIKNYKFDKFSPDFDSFGSEIRDLSFALFLDLKYFDGKNDKLFNKIIDLKDTIKSTQDRAFVIMALQMLNSKEDVSVRVKNGDEIYYVKNGEILDLNLTTNSIKLSPTAEKPYFSIVAYGYENLPLKHEFSDKTLSIYREFLDISGNLVNLDEIKLNDIIFAKITLKSKAFYKDILVHQKAPSCLEIVNERVVQSIRTDDFKDGAKFSYVDIKDSSITHFLEPFYDEVTFYVPFRAVLKGSCVLPEVRAERMHDERVNDYDLERRFITIK